MKSYLSLAWKELKAQKVTSLLILLAVILSTIATTAMGQSEIGRASCRERV